MTKLSTDWAQVQGTSVLRVSRSCSSAEGADVLRALGAYMVQGLALETSYNGGCGRWFWGVRDNDGVIAGSGLHNHLQSSRKCNTSRAHSRSTLLANPSPASWSWHSIMTILFPWRKGRYCCSGVLREGVGSPSHLGGRIDGGVSGGKRVGRGGVPLRSRRAGISRPGWKCPVLQLVRNLLCHLVTAVVSPVLFL